MANKRTNERSTLHIGVRYDTDDAKRDIRSLINNFELLQKESQIDVGLKNIEGVGGAIHEFKTLDGQLTDIADDSKLAGKQIDENISKAVNSAIDNISTLTGKTNDLLDLLRKIGRGEGSADDIKKLATDLQTNLGLFGAKFDANEILGMKDVQQQFEALSKGVVQFASTWGVSAQGVIESNLGISGSLNDATDGAKEFGKAIHNATGGVDSKDIDKLKEKLERLKKVYVEIDDVINRVKDTKAFDKLSKEEIDNIDDDTSKQIIDSFANAKKIFDSSTNLEEKKQAAIDMVKALKESQRLLAYEQEDDDGNLWEISDFVDSDIVNNLATIKKNMQPYFEQINTLFKTEMESLEKELEAVGINITPEIDINPQTPKKNKTKKKIQEVVEQSVPDKVETPVEVEVDVKPKIDDTKIINNLEDALKKFRDSKRKDNVASNEAAQLVLSLKDLGYGEDDIKQRLSTNGKRTLASDAMGKAITQAEQLRKQLPAVSVEIDKLNRLLGEDVSADDKFKSFVKAVDSGEMSVEEAHNAITAMKKELAKDDASPGIDKLKNALKQIFKIKDLEELQASWRETVAAVESGSKDWVDALADISQAETNIRNLRSKAKDKDINKFKSQAEKAKQDAADAREEARKAQDELESLKRQQDGNIKPKSNKTSETDAGLQTEINNINEENKRLLDKNRQLEEDIEQWKSDFRSAEQKYADELHEKLLIQDQLEESQKTVQELRNQLSDGTTTSNGSKTSIGTTPYVETEIKDLEKLEGKVKEVEATIRTTKTQAFKDEQQVVESVVDAEKIKLGELEAKVVEVDNKIGTIGQGAQNGASSTSLNLYDQILDRMKKIADEKKKISKEPSNKKMDYISDEIEIFGNNIKDIEQAQKNIKQLTESVKYLLTLDKSIPSQSYAFENGGIKDQRLVDIISSIRESDAPWLSNWDAIITQMESKLISLITFIKNNDGKLEDLLSVDELSVLNTFGIDKVQKEFEEYCAETKKITSINREARRSIEDIAEDILVLGRAAGASEKELDDLYIYLRNFSLPRIEMGSPEAETTYVASKLGVAQPSSVSPTINEKTTAFQEEQSTVNSVVNAEIQDLNRLKKAIEKVTAAVNYKTKAFRDEQDVVDKVVGSEIGKLSDLKDELEKEVKIPSGENKDENDNNTPTIDSTLSSTLLELQKALSAMIGSTDPATQNTDADKGLNGIANNVKSIYDHLVHEPEEKKPVQNDGTEDATSDIDEKKLVGVLDELTQIISQLQSWLNNNINKDNSDELNEFNTNVITPLSQAIQDLRDAIKVDDDKPTAKTPEVDTTPEQKLTDTDNDKEKPTINIEGLNSISENVERIHGILSQKEKTDEQLATSIKNAADGLKDATKYIEEDAKSRNDTNKQYMDSASKISTAEGRKQVLEQALTGTDMKQVGTVDYTPLANGKVKVSTVVEDTNGKLYDFAATVDKVGQSVAPLVENGRRSQQVIEERRKALEAQTVAEQKATQASEDKLVNGEEVSQVSNGTTSINVLDGVLKSTTKMYDDYSAANVGNVPDALKDEYNDLLNLVKKIKEENRNLEKSEVESIEKTCKAIQNKIILHDIESQKYDDKLSKMKDSTVDNGTSLLGDKDAVTIQKNFDEIEERTKKLQAKLNESDKSIFNREELKQEQKELDNLIAKTEKLITTAKANKSKGALTKPQLNQFIKAESAYNESDTNSKQLDLSQEGLASLDRYKQKYQELVALKEKFQSSSKNDITEDDIKAWSRLTQELKECREEYEVFEKVASSGGKMMFASDEAIQNTESLKDEMMKLAKASEQGKASAPQWADEFNKLTMTFEDVDNQLKTVVVTYDSVTKTLTKSVVGVKQTQSSWEKFTTSVSNKMREMGAYFATFVSFYEVVAVVRQGITYVKEIDSALAELKKVTDETDVSYNKFLHDMSKTASIVGSTVKDLTTMSAEWARLGYSMEESAKLAESTAILLNVSEFKDATEASEALISTMQAFQYAADESTHVVDVLNEVGNNYAVSSDGLATALQDSASALMEGGNNLEQSVALVAAANKVVQDPSSVGSALRTISLRLRGTSVEVLEELGEETDNVVESTSKLQSKIKALSGVDILTKSGDYKDTYTILSEIGEVWESMADIDQAALLELMAGKNRANTLSAILSNMKDLKGAYEDALRAEGSAYKENETHLNSIQGRIELFMNSLQTMWMKSIDREIIKEFIDFGTILLDIVGNVGVLETAFAGLLTYLSASKKYKLDFASLFGIHDLEQGFSIFGKQGLTGVFAKTFNNIAEWFKNKRNNIADIMLGDQNDIEMSVQDWASLIKDNINDFVTIDTSVIDSEIDDVQNKLTNARKRLSDAKAADWDYYKKFKSATPAKDRDARVSDAVHEIKTLEDKLIGLQAKRDEIISSATTKVATSMAEPVRQEVNAYQSLLPVLSQVKDIKLSIGNEQDAAIKIDAMSEAAQNGQVALSNYVSTLDDSDIALKAYAASVDDGNYSLAGFQQFIAQHNAELKASGISAKAAAVGHQILNAALSMGISLLVSGAISYIMKLVNAEKEAAQAAEDALVTYNKAQKELREQKQTIDELSKSYERLSKGVDLDTNENISLTTDSYEEYLNVCNDIADMYPHLVSGFDAQGNAILSLKGNVDELIQAYRDASQAARQQVIASGGGVFDTFKSTYDSDASTTFGDVGYTQQVKLAEKLQELINSGTEKEINEFFDKLNSGNIEIDGQKYSNIELDALASSDGAGLDKNVWMNGVFARENIDIELFKQQSSKLLSFIKSTTTKINTETQKVKSLMDAYLGEDFDYAQLSNKSRAFIDQIVSHLNAEFINGFDSADALYNWIKTNIVDAFQDSSVVDAINDLSKLQLEFVDGDISYSDYKKQLSEHLSKIQNKFDEESLTQIKIGVGIDEVSLQTAWNHTLNLLGNNLDSIYPYMDRVASLSVEDLQIAGQLEVPEGTVLSWEELLTKIEDVKVAATQDFDITSYTKAISSHSAAISEYQEALQKLGKGSFTMDDFMALIEKYPDLAKGVDVSSNAFYGLSRNLNRVIKTSTKNFIKDLKELRKSLVAAGKSTDTIDQLIVSIEKMPDDALDDIIQKYSTLSDKINEAKTAQDKLLASMEENPNEGYETRGEAMDYMKEAMKKGEIGSESNLWNVAERYGFTYDSAKTINENADALAKYIAIREKWFKQDDDNDDRTKDGYSYKGTESFIKDVESAVESSEELQKHLTWNYDEDTGTLNFEAKNKDWDTIVSILSETKELAGLTSEEFADMMVQVGQYFGIDWGNYDDALDHLNEIATGASDAKTKVEEYGKTMQDYFGEKTTIDLSARPMVSGTEMQSAGWTDVEPDSYATVYSSTFSNEDGTKSIVVTPILPNGKVLSPEELETYAKKLLDGEEIDSDVNIQLAKFDGTNSVNEANKYAEALHKAQEAYDQLRDTLGINAAIDKSGIDGLKEIYDIQNAIETKADGTVVINEEAFREALEGAKYTEDQIDLIIEKIKTLNADAFNIDPFKIDETLINQGISGLEKIEKIKDSLKKDETTGLTVFDTDIFTSVLQEAGYTKNQIDELIKKIQEYEGIVSTSGSTDPLGLSNANFGIDTLRASLNTLDIEFDEKIGKWGDGLKDIQINVPDLVSTLKANGWTDEAIKNYCTQLSQTNIEGFKVKIDQKEVDEVLAKANEVPEEEKTEYTITGTGIKTLKDINTEWSNVPTTKSTEYTITETTIKKTKEDSGKKWWNPFTWGSVDGTANANGSWGAKQSGTSLVGELGPEILVRNGRWTTVGDNGAEFTDIKKGDIIFNHKQSEELLKNGSVTGRGRLYGRSAFAHGTAFFKGGGTYGRYNFSGTGGYVEYNVNDQIVETFGDYADALDGASDSAKDMSDAFEDTINWIDVLFTRIESNISEQEAIFENIIDSTGGILQKEYLYNEIYGQLYSKANASLASRDYYAAKAEAEMAGLPYDIQAKIRSGAISIQDFKGTGDENGDDALQKYVDKINKAIEYYDKISEYEQQYWTTITEIADKAVERQEDVAQGFENEIGLVEHLNSTLESYNDLQETKEGFATEAYYDAQIDANETMLDQYRAERDALQDVFDEEVRLGRVKIGSQQWFDMQQAIYDVEDAIIDTEASIEDLQNSINDLHWARFDELINRFEYVGDEISNVIQLLSHDPDGLIMEELRDLTSDNWATNSGLTTIGMYAQEMERAQHVANQYADAIKDLEKDYAAGKYNETEYLTKLNELIGKQYENIEKYFDAKDAIIELNEARVDAIKDGIQKEIDAYDELIQKKKELLDKEQD